MGCCIAGTIEGFSLSNYKTEYVFNLSLIISNLTLKLISLGNPQFVKIFVLFWYVFEYKSGGGLGASYIPLITNIQMPFIIMYFNFFILVNQLV
ncbi:hypothetical protein VIGAN_06230300 [Vigna angularis var. angularis]|uniref:Uncharacterized protein n=1 Tax=Vigna angularis var. angularis TaxID=157739 RepID=A0A0S3SDT5_PHAAN|nr:hypothetical protein VIGAN_06230300 [Vigna angularis var. angularis]